MSIDSVASPVVYDSTNRELRTVQAYFAQKGIGVLDIMWQTGVAVGGQVASDMLLAHIIWTSGPADPLKAPIGCTGNIEWMNPRIPYVFLDSETVTLFRLSVA